MKQEEAGILEDVLVPYSIRRHKLLPVWIKVFTWLFMIAGAMTPLVYVIGFTGALVSLSLFGLQTTEAYSVNGMIITVLFLLKGVAAFGLWLEQDWAIKVAKVDAVLGIVACTTIKCLLPFINPVYSFTIPLELVLLIPYLIKLNRIQPFWEESIVNTALLR